MSLLNSWTTEELKVRWYYEIEKAKRLEESKRKHYRTADRIADELARRGLTPDE